MIRKQIEQSHPRALVLGVTGDWAFAAGAVILAFKRHNPDVDADIHIFCDDSLSSQDREVFKRLGVNLIPFAGLTARINEDAMRVFSPLSLAKFSCFDLLRKYESVIWLDSDVLVQDNVADLFAMGPFAMAREDPSFLDERNGTKSEINLKSPVADYDGNSENLNSGVIVFRSNLDNPEILRDICLDFIKAHGPHLRYPDQAAFNFLVQKLRRENEKAFAQLPQKFNTHPRNPKAGLAPVVHAFGAYKLWNDGLTAICFPEWQRDYARWLNLGGTPYKGVVDNAGFLNDSAFSMLKSLFNTLEKAESALADLKQKLAIETTIRNKLENLLRNVDK